MATIRRHPVPSDSYNPNRPLNDLGRDQLAHFIHVSERLPAKLRADLPAVPSANDGLASSNFIAEVTQRLLGPRKTSLRVLPKKSRKSTDLVIGLAAVADPASSREATPRKQSSGRKSKPRSSKA